MNNRAGEMEAFVEIIDHGSFAAAAQRLRLSPSAVSKLITRLEQRLDTRLLTRSTRRLRLTPEGEAYLARARQILAQIADTERLVSGGAETPTGRLRVNSSVAFGVRHIVPLLPEFLRLHPGIELDLTLTDAVVDLIGERTDVGIRIGSLTDSSLIARRLAESAVSVVASRRYLEQHGEPRHPADLLAHNCINFNFRRSRNDWPFRLPNGELIRMAVPGNLKLDNGETVRQLVVAGAGLARIGHFHVAGDIARGDVVRVLEDFNPGDTELIHAVFVGHDHLAARVRAFVDFLVDHVGPL